MQAKDVVLAIDGKAKHDVASLLAQIATLPPGTQTKLSLVRDRKPVDVDVTVGRRPKPAQS